MSQFIDLDAILDLDSYPEINQYLNIADGMTVDLNNVDIASTELIQELQVKYAML